ncbi:allantoinase [Paenibacillus wulumuqiensis]|uniref:allantoinase n=1 Tax=Paenibacillus wulumuqiensis TaxID=1567107 RepID=UPI000619C242|nr:allantoinase [Paenibacillus wulumuqiensis]
MHVYDLVVIGGNVIFPDAIEQTDIAVHNGKIAHIGRLSAPDIAGAVQVIHADGMQVMAGMIDAHVHFNEPGFGDWEGFKTGSAALAAGGCTTYMDMPLNGVPPTVTTAALEWKRELAAGHSHVDYGCWGGLVPGNLEEMEALSEQGVCGFKAFMSAPGDPDEEAFRNVDDTTLLEGMQRIARIGRVLALHAESEPVVSKLTASLLAEGRTTAADYSASRPIEAELEAVIQALEYGKQTGCPLHFVHISSAAAVQMIQNARTEGMDVTLETCPHYLTLTDQDLEQIGPAAKCAPPLRSLEEQELLWQCIAAGQIDMITSDHSPCPTALKTDAAHMFEAWGGISGAQHSLELMISEGYVKRGLPLPLISRMVSLAPAQRFGLYPQKGEIGIGADADLVIVDLDTSYTVDQEQLLYRHKHSPYVGREIFCQVQLTMVRGHIVYTREHGMTDEPIGQSLCIPNEKPLSLF